MGKKCLFFLLSFFNRQKHTGVTENTTLRGDSEHTPLSKGCVHFFVRTGSRLMTQRVKHGNGSCFGFIPNFLDLFSLQLFDPYIFISFAPKCIDINR